MRCEQLPHSGDQVGSVPNLCLFACSFPRSSVWPWLAVHAPTSLVPQGEVGRVSWRQSPLHRLCAAFPKVKSILSPSSGQAS